MANNLYEGELSKTDDWGSVQSNNANGKAASGAAVQKYIKDALNKKFGYLYYNRSALKYYIFADEDDYAKWEADPSGNADKKLFEFDAPSPASITFNNQSRQQVTVLSTAKDNVISFNYKCLNSSNAAIAEPVTIKTTVTCNGSSTTESESVAVDFDTYSSENGTPYSKNITSMLSVGTNTVSVTITGNTTSASTTLAWSYNVVELTLSSSFNDNFGTAIDISNDSFTLTFPTTGGGTAAKYLELYIDSEALVQSEYEGAFFSGKQMSGVGAFTQEVTIYLYNKAGELIWNVGKHTLQARCYVVTETGAKLYSDMLYYEFVIADKSSTSDVIYLLFKQQISGKENPFGLNDVVSMNVEQYDTLENVDFTVYSSTGAQVTVSFNLYNVTYETVKDEEGVSSLVRTRAASAFAQQNYNVPSGEIKQFTRKFTESGEIDIVGSSVGAVNELYIQLTVKQSTSINVSEKTTFLKAKYSASNRSNSEPDDEISTWKYTSGSKTYNAVFDGVAWNSQNGWLDNSNLTLINGSTVTFPFNLFDPTSVNGATLDSGCVGTNGMTFEIDFETFNSQDDDSVIMEFKSSDQTVNHSYIKITATSATIQSQQGKSITTNFKDNERQKIAFIINSNSSVEGSIYPNLMLIMVNGVLDRAINIDNADSFEWTRVSKATDATFSIGNTDNEVGVKLYGIRIYNTAVTLDEELDNYIVDSDDIESEYKDNDVVNASGTSSDGAAAGKDIDIDLVRKKCRTMVIYGDLENTLENAGKKGYNYEFDIEYRDPQDPEKSFFCRNAFLSCQGTSSMQYPYKNLRFYLNKEFTSADTDASKQSFGSAANVNDDPRHIASRTYYTEMYPNGWYNTEDLNDLGEQNTNGKRKGIPFTVNKKTNKSGYARIDPCQAKVISENSDEVLYTYDTKNSKYVPCQYGDINTSTFDYYIIAYRPVDYDYAVQLRRSGNKLYTRTQQTTVNDDGEKINVTQSGYSDSDTNEYPVYTFSEASKKKVKLNSKTQYYTLCNTWSQSGAVEAGEYIKANKNAQGLTDRWTLKTDYAESSMTHNSGIGRFWGECMKNVQIGTDHNGYACRTTAQENAANESNWFDVRTSCFGLPMVVFTASMEIKEDGSRKYGSPTFLAQFNWMTDKGSTPLFGFENMYNENAEVVYGNEDDTFCFEGSVNGSQLIAGKSVIFDQEPTLAQRNDKDMKSNCKEGANGKWYLTGEYRPIWSSYEQRWPDPDEACDLDTYHLESFIRWMNFFKPAVNYTVDGIEGYNFSAYSVLTFDQAKTKHASGEALYQRYYDSDLGEYQYAKEGTAFTDDETGLTTAASDNAFSEDDTLTVWYSYKKNIDYENVSKSLNTESIGSDIFIGKVAGFDANVRYADADNVEDYYVDVYLTKRGTKYYYTNEFGVEQQYTGSVSSDGYEVDEDGKSWRSKTYIDYFKASKYDHLEVYKVAAYYIYLMRFAGVDQVIKNTMTTTEDRQHFYFINYDNDTTCGVRNDGILIFNWDVDRDTYDTTSGANGSYAFAGASSVFWNTLEMDEDFMNIVNAVDNALYSQGLLTYDVVTEVMNEQFVHYWCPRLYNKQEYIKYLSIFITGDNSKYLNFLHGTRESHRAWWLRHRFDLYDSKWMTGEYIDYKWKWLVDCSGDSPSPTNRASILTITAASKYYFCCQENNEQDSDDWFVELKAGEYTTFKTPNGLTIGDPMQLVGPQKVKVMNFRPGNTYLRSIMNINDPIDKTSGKNWINQKGILLTSLLIGDGDPNRQVAMTGISGINALSTLEELDLRYCVNLTPIEINELNSLHIYRAFGSGCTTFAPAEGVTLYEVSLPDGTTSSTASGVEDESVDIEYKRTTMISMTSVNFKANPAEYVEASAYMAETAADNHITLYKKEKKTGEYVEGNYNQNFFYNSNDETYDGKYYVKYSTDLFPVWNYVPDRYLTSLTLNGITSDVDPKTNKKYFDDYTFIQTWINAIKEYVTTGKDSKGNAIDHSSSKNYALTAKDINWTNVPVAFVINGVDDDVPGLQTVSITNNGDDLTGKITLVGSDKNGKLTYEEYLKICEIYGEDVFNGNSKLIFDAPEAMFFTSSLNVTSTTTTADGKITLEGNTVINTPALPIGTSFFKYVRGENDTLRATIFPYADRTVEYMFYYYNQKSLKDVLATRTPETGLAADGTVTYEVAGIKLVSKNNIATLTTDSTNTSNQFITIVVKDSTNNKTYTSNKQYASVVAAIYPTSLKITGEQSISHGIADTDKEYEYTVTFNNQDIMNVNIKKLNIDVTSTTSGGSTYVSVLTDKTICDNVNREYKFYVKYIMPKDKLQVKFNVSATIDTKATNTPATGSLDVVINPVKFTSITLVNKETGAKINKGGTAVLSHTGKSDFEIVVNDASKYNIPIAKVEYGEIEVTYAEYFEISDNTNTGFSITVADNLENGVYKSFNYSSGYTITVTDKYDNKYEYTVTFKASIVYPEVMYLGVNKTSLTTEITDDIDIALTNNQGTSRVDSTGYKQYGVSIGTNRYVKYNFHVEPEIKSNGSVTIPYTINITNYEIHNSDENSDEPIDTEKYGVTLTPITDTTTEESSNHGTIGFYLSVPGVLNSIVSTTVTVTAACVFDSNDNGTSGEANEILTKTFTINITRSYAYATSVADIQSALSAKTITNPINTYDETNVFVIDNKCRYYQLSGWGDAAENDSTISPIGILFGCGYTSSAITWYGIALKDLSTSMPLINDAFIAAWYETQKSYDCNQFTSNATDSNNNSYSGKTLTSIMMNIIANNNVTNADKTAIYAAYHYFDEFNIDNIYGYIPTFNEGYLIYAHELVLNNVNTKLNTILNNVDCNGYKLATVIGWEGMKSGLNAYYTITTSTTNISNTTFIALTSASDNPAYKRVPSTNNKYVESVTTYTLLVRPLITIK